MTNTEILRNIKLLVLDMDGVLTDGGIYVSSDGSQMRRFHAHDGQGIKDIQAAGIPVGILTGSRESELIEIRAGMLGISPDLLSIATADKIDTLRSWTDRLGIELMEVAYVGDDHPDIAVMRAVGLSACPSDALPAVREVSKLVLGRAGGHGCVRELIDMILAAQA